VSRRTKTRSKQLALDRYDTDKIRNHYLERYDPIVQPWVDKQIKLLEIGVQRGGSLLLWRDYFPLGTIVGIDINLPQGFSPGERIEVFEGSQADPLFLSEVANKVAPEGFDIIIDDASHIGELTKIAFWHLFDHHLKPGGLYVIEDWGTGYWDDFPDGRSVSHRVSASLRLQGQVLSLLAAVRLQRRLLSFLKHHPKIVYSAKTPFQCHSYGMVGFVKELVDEQGAADMTMTRSNNKPKRNSKFESILIVPSIVFVTKASSFK